MDRIQSPIKLSSFLDEIVKEGLSFSDYFDDSVPADVKPVYNITPMEEDSSEERKKRISSNKETDADRLSFGKRIGEAWMNKEGKYFYDYQTHSEIARNYLKDRNIPFRDRDLYTIMYNLGFIKIVVDTSDKLMEITYFHNKPTIYQLRQIKNDCIEQGWTLNDAVKHQPIPIDESLLPQKDPLTPEKDSSKNYGEDYPLRAKDLYKGLWENDKSYNYLNFWLDKSGELHGTRSHFNWAKIHLQRNDINYHLLYEDMFKLGYIRISVNPGESILYVDYGTKGGFIGNPSSKQWSVIRNMAIEKYYTVHNDTLNKNVNLNESKYVDKGSKQLFIESMTPDNMDEFKSHLVKLFSYLKEELQLRTIPKVKLVSDDKNASKVLGKTAYYDPSNKLVVLYTTGRHQKDILRSFAHEIIHHWQHENEKLSGINNKNSGTKDPQYAQNNMWLRQMEKQAYLLGNILFRDWEDIKKSQNRKSNFKVNEKNYSIGNEYPPKKMDYRG